MSGIFRRALRMPQPVQSPLGVLSGAAVGGGAILPAHVPSAAVAFAPALRRSVSAVSFAGAPAFGTAVLRAVLLPQALAASGSAFLPTIDDGDLVLPASVTNGQSFATLRLTLRLSPAAYANAASVHAPAAGPAGVKTAPLVASGGAVHAPRVDAGHTFGVVGTLNVSGYTPRPPARRSRLATWPNLPKVEAPAWRLTVVTPEVARARARSLMVQRRRAEQALRKREAKRKLDRYLEEIIEADIAHTVVRLVSEEG